MENYLIKNITIVNEGLKQVKDILLSENRIKKISDNISITANCIEINGENKYLLPGVIDDQVHFREPGLTHKGTIYSESRAAVAGGVCSFMEMPNTIPPAFTQQLLENKYKIAVNSSLANYSFYMGTSNENADEALRSNERKNLICGIKIFMGSSTGGLLVDNFETLNHLFANSEVLIATHCEDEKIISKNKELLLKEKKVLDPNDHPVIRSESACYHSSLAAVQLAQRYNTRLHILHISTEKELSLFTNILPLKEKKITAEVCVHHLHFSAEDYSRLGNLIKCNPAIKAKNNRTALWKALLDNKLDVIATDHAPHTMEEKKKTYEESHAGLPLVQHSLLLMLDYVNKGFITIERVAEKMSHAVATCFQLKDRGFIREGYYADVVIVDLKQITEVKSKQIFYKCGWSPLEGARLSGQITHTFVNGHLVYENGNFDDSVKGQRLIFDRG